MQLRHLTTLALPRLWRLADGWLDQLQASLPVQARWVAAAGEGAPELTGPAAAAPGDARARLALQVLSALQALAQARGVCVHAADLTLDWLEGEPAGGHLRGKLVVASPAPGAQVQALADALGRQLQEAGLAAESGWAVHLECRHVQEAWEPVFSLRA